MDRYEDHAQISIGGAAQASSNRAQSTLGHIPGAFQQIQDRLGRLIENARMTNERLTETHERLSPSNQAGCGVEDCRDQRSGEIGRIYALLDSLEEELHRASSLSSSLAATL